MHYILILSISLLHQGTINPFAPYRWENRVIVINGPTELVKKQVQVLEVDKPGMDDRDIVLFNLTGQDSSLSPKTDFDVKEIQSFLKLDSKVFQFILIGKDGGVKLRSDKIISLERVFGLIDSMPMRRAEMRRKNQ